MLHQPYTREDFHRNPLMFYYEVTQACDLVCKHCRASAQEEAASDELSSEQSLALIDQVATFPRKPTLCFTGGDPLKRKDLFELIRHAVEQQIQVALTPSATPLATREAFDEAKHSGVHALGISLDGVDAATHDAFRGFEGSFEKTMEMLQNAAALDMPVQVNTTITRRNFDQIDAIAKLLAEQKIAMWSAFFLVAVGRGVEEKSIEPEEYEIAFEKLWHHAQTKPYAVKTTEAPHYRRYVLRQGGNPLAAPGSSGHPGAEAARRDRAPLEDAHRIPGQESRSEAVHRGKMHRAPLGVTDGRGIMFLAHNGEIFPAGFLPLVCGKFPQDSVVDTYQHHPTFRSLQDPDQYKGICGACEYRYVCGGSRARAYALTGDPLGPEPHCVYQVGQDPVVEP